MKYLLDTCIIQAVLKREARSDNLQVRIEAAQAIATGSVCVTDNLRHFLRIPGLTIENWLQLG